MGTDKTYDSKVPCKKCGSVVRYKSSSNCVDCTKAASRHRLVTGRLYYVAPDEYPIGREVAAILRLQKFWPEKPCLRGHTGLHDTRTGGCFVCMRRRRMKKAPEQKRVDAKVLADRRARWAAEEEGEKKYASPRPCTKCGEQAPERYVRGGACAYCASARSRQVYYASKPPVDGPGSWETRFIQENLREEDEAREAQEVAAGKLPKKKKE